MKANNPHFAHVHRAPYMLPHLVKTLGNADYGTALTQQQREVVDAIQSHAHNSIETIVSGLAVVGQMLSFVASSQFELERDQLSGLGDLIKYLAVEAEYLHEVETDMQVRIDQSDLAAARTTTGRPKARQKQTGSTPA